MAGEFFTAASKERTVEGVGKRTSRRILKKKLKHVKCETFRQGKRKIRSCHIGKFEPAKRVTEFRMTVEVARRHDQRAGRQRLGLDERRALALARLAGVAAGQVVVDQAHRLHERVDGGGADEAPAALLEVAGEGLRVVITPDEVGEGLLLGELDRPLGVVDRRLDLAAVADDPGVLEQALDVLRR